MNVRRQEMAQGTNAQVKSAADSVARTLSLFHPPGSVVEVRALDIPGRGKSYTAAGYFTDIEEATEAVERLEKRKPEGVYFTLNSCDPQLLARAPNVVTDHPKATTADGDITRRRWLLVDIDPKRPKGTSSTDAQLQTAHETVDAVRDWLAEQLWPEPVEAMSGNGWHLLYPIDLPADDSSRKLVESVLKALASRFDGAEATIDRAVFNAARITKLYGTTARKGHHTDLCPHRRSELVYVPDYLELGEATRDVVPLERLQAVADLAREPDRKQTHASNGGHRLDVARWLYDRHRACKTRETSDGRTAYDIICPFDPSHKGTDCAIMQAPSGALSAKCFHSSCSGRGWQHFKLAIGAPDPEHYDPPLYTSDERSSAVPPDAEPARERFTIYTAKDLAEGDFSVEYHIPHVLAVGVPTVISGSFKTLKTSIAVDLHLSLCAGHPFLGKFCVTRPYRAAFLSGESGMSALQCTYRRVAASKGWGLGMVEGLILSPDLPRLADPTDLPHLERFIQAHRLEVLIVDPAYLCMNLDDRSAGNLFMVGRQLRPLTERARKHGCTIIVIHHNSKASANSFEPAELSDIQWSGFAEWAGQWLLLSRREKFDPDSAGEHKLWMNIGGRPGHMGLYAPDIIEGKPEDPGGRRWDVDVKTATEARAESAEAAAEARRRKGADEFERDADKVRRVMRRFPSGETKTKLRESTPVPGARFDRIFSQMMLDGEIVQAGEITKGNNRRYETFRLPESRNPD